jgi:hypothetical protein
VLSLNKSTIWLILSKSNEYITTFVQAMKG